MATLYISEYPDQRTVSPVAVEPALVNQTVTYTGTAGVSTAFGGSTRVVRIHTDGICSFKFGTAPTALTTDARMVAGQTEYFCVIPGLKVSAIVNT